MNATMPLPPNAEQHLQNATTTHQQREQSLLRELIVLTLRHANGDYIRFVPPQHDEWGVSNPNRIEDCEFWGVRLHPCLGLMDTTTTPIEAADSAYGNVGGYTKQDLQFKSSYTSILKSGANDAISLSAQCGLLYSKIDAFIDSMEINDNGCSVTQALSVRMEEEMEWYHGRLAELESKLNHSAPEGTTDANAKNETKRGLTLRSLVVRLSPIKDRLLSLSMLVDGVAIRNLRGGKLLSSILTHSHDGNTRHATLVKNISAQISIPWYKMLHEWITHGILEDVHSEFFIVENIIQENDNNSSGYFSWHRRFGLMEGLIPRQIITEELAREVLVVGKGINFVRYCLHDRDWEVNDGEEAGESMDVEGESKSELKYGYATLSDLKSNQDESYCISTLHSVVTASSAKIHRHILDSLLNKHQLITHLHALKRFMFLGQGDFVSSLVESLHHEFRGRTTLAGIYSHTLNGVLEGALRTSNARYLPDCVLNRLMPRLLVDGSDPDRYWMGPPPKDDDDEGLTPWEDREDEIQDPWDYICLEYAIDSPLDAIVHTEAMESYQRVFMFLFRLKRVEWMLNNSWRQSTALNHAILIETKAGGADAAHISEAAEQSSFLLRRISSTCHAMLHFVSNLQNYLMFEVLEGGWEGLVQSVNNSQSLDGVISAHDSYLNEILVKTLLSNRTGDGHENGKGKSLEDLLRRLLSIALKFGKFQDFIFGNALAALNKSAETRRRVAETSRSGTWGRKDIDEEEGQVFLYLADEQLSDFVGKTAREFDKVLGALLKMLKKEVFDDGGFDGDDSQPSLNHDALRFLLFRLDYSGYYHRQAKARAKKASAS